MGGFAQSLLKGGAEFLEHLAPYYRSMEGQLNKTAIGKVANDLLANKYEPLWKRGQAEGTKLIQKIFEPVPSNLHSEVTKTVFGGTSHLNPLVDAAAKKLRNIYGNQATSRPITMDLKKHYENELLRWTDWNQRYARSYARELVFGKNNEALTAIVKRAYKERGLVYSQNVADNLSVFFREDTRGQMNMAAHWRAKVKQGVDAIDDPRWQVQSPYHSTEQWESKLRSMMAWAFTPRIVIPHLSQVLNSMIYNGIKPTAQAMSAIMRDPQSALLAITEAGAFEDELWFHMLDAAKKDSATPLGKYLMNFKQPGFKTVRKWQMVLSGIAGKYRAREAAFDLVQGKNIEDAKIMLKQYGIDANTVLQNKGLTPEQEMQAIYRGVDETMFIRSGRHTPAGWDKSRGYRLMFVYKHYMFNEGRLLKNMLVRDYKRGPVEFAKTVGMLGTIFPMVGYGIGVLENIATGHDPTKMPESSKFFSKFGAPVEMDEYLDAMAHVGGFGIAYSMMRAARRRALAETIIGPIFGSVVDLGTDILTGNKREIVRDVTRKLGVAGPLATNLGIPSKKKSSSGYHKY